MVLQLIYSVLREAPSEASHFSSNHFRSKPIVHLLLINDSILINNSILINDSILINYAILINYSILINYAILINYFLSQCTLLYRQAIEQ